MNKKIIIGLALVVVLAVGGYALTKDKDDKKSSSNNSSTSQTSTDEKSQTDAKTSTVQLKSQTVGQDVDCSTFTYDELGKVWGVPFVDTDINKVQELSTAGGKQYTCDYNETDSGKGVTFAIEYREYPNEEAAKQAITDTRSTEKYGDTKYYVLEEKSGVGDEAFFWSKYNADATAKLQNQQMYVRKSNVVFMLSGVNIDGVSSDYKDKLLKSFQLHF